MKSPELDDVEQLAELGSSRAVLPRGLNISSIRSVTRNPPTTLIVPNMTATVSSALLSVSCAAPVASSRMPPTTTIPWIALVPDISGVCSVLGTLEITR